MDHRDFQASRTSLICARERSRLVEQHGGALGERRAGRPQLRRRARLHRAPRPPVPWPRAHPAEYRPGRAAVVLRAVLQVVDDLQRRAQRVVGRPGARGSRRARRARSARPASPNSCNSPSGRPSRHSAAWSTSMRKAVSRSCACRGVRLRSASASRSARRDRLALGLCRAGRPPAGRAARASRPAPASRGRRCRRRRARIVEGQDRRAMARMRSAARRPENSRRDGPCRSAGRRRWLVTRRPSRHGPVGLDAPLPQAAAAARVLIGGIEGEQPYRRARSPAAPGPTAATGDRTAASAGRPAPSSPRRATPSDCAPARPPNSGQQRRREVGQRHADDGAGEQERRIAQLGIGRARDHAADVVEIADRGAGCARARSGRARSGPRLELLRQRAIVDQRVADRRDAARRPAAPRGAPACSRRPPPAALRSRTVHPGERIEHLEEEDEGRDEARARRGSRSAASPSARSARARRAAARATSSRSDVRSHGRCRRR